MWNSNKVAAYARRSEHMSRLDAMVKMAARHEGMFVEAKDFDKDQMGLNVLNGTIDLLTGELRPHCKEDLITKLAPINYDPEASCDIWLNFLARIMNGSDEMVGFIQRVLGYCLTGRTSERLWFLLHGPGGNGKTTFINLVLNILGDCALQAAADTFLVRKSEGPRNDIARLRGARFVSTSEPDSRKSLDTALMKLITGQDQITCRPLYRENFQFRPQFKIFMASNHRPDIKVNDEAFWGRTKCIPFNVSIPDAEQDKNLSEKLLEEAPGILSWMVRGCLEWQRGGLRIPEIVERASSDYRAEVDTISEFLNQPGVLRIAGQSVSKIRLYLAYKDFCDGQNLEPIGRNKFNAEMRSRGFQELRVSRLGIASWHGIGLEDAI
jgi:putative DNA primase/helicase